MKIPPTVTRLVLAAALGALVAACGSSTPTSTSATQPPTTSTTTSTTSANAHATTSHSSTTAKTTGATTTSVTTTVPTTTTSTNTATATTTRTATAPAFVGTNPTSDAAIGHDLAVAVAVLARSGYTPLRTSTYRAGDTLRVLIGTRPGPGAPTERAFFFDQTIYLGTDARAASAHISVLSQSDTEVTLAYAIHDAGASTPSAIARVRFALDMGHVTALDPLPSAAKRR